MQVILRGVQYGGALGRPCVSFEGPGVPCQPIWMTGNIPYPHAYMGWGDPNVDGNPPYAYIGWDPPYVHMGPVIPPDDPLSPWGNPYVSPTFTAWTMYTEPLTSEGLPAPVVSPEPVYGRMPPDTGDIGWYGFVSTGYIAYCPFIEFNSLDNLPWFADHTLTTTTPNTEIGGEDVAFTIRPECEDFIRNATSVLYTQSAEHRGYIPTQCSLNFIDILDGGTPSTVDLSTATHLNNASAYQTMSTRGNNYIYDYVFDIFRGPIVVGNTTPDIFWTQRVLCEETQ